MHTEVHANLRTSPHLESVMRVVEECGELTQALAKAERFGWFNFHPARPDGTNLDDVKREMDDVVEAIEKLQADMREVRHRFYAGAPLQP